MCNFTHAQGNFASIRKNVNVRAIGLKHDLNKSKDTLKLSSTDKIFRVYTVGDFSGIVDQYLNANKFEVSLRSFEKGKYVFVVDQSNRKIVFQIYILNGEDLLPDEWFSNTALASTLDEVDDLDDEATIESLDLLKESTKFSKFIKTKKSNLKHFRSKKYRNNKRVNEDRLKERTKKLNIPKKNLKPYNLTDLNRNGMQSRDEARKIMAIERQKIRDSIKKTSNN